MFHRRAASLDGLQAKCKVCTKKYDDDRYPATRKKRAAQAAKWAQANPERIVERSRVYYGKNRTKILNYGKIYHRNRRRTDLNYKLKCELRSRLGHAVKNGSKSGSAVRDLGCTIPAFKLYLESKFRPGMSWDNWSRFGWHIDHIKPLAKFDLTKRKQFLEACHYTNLQPLWAEENLKKSDRPGWTPRNPLDPVSDL